MNYAWREILKYLDPIRSHRNSYRVVTYYIGHTYAYIEHNNSDLEKIGLIELAFPEAIHSIVVEMHIQRTWSR